MSEKSESSPSNMFVASDSAICGGCRRCEMACSLFHHGECNMELASIHVNKDVFSGEYEVETCRQCKEPECVAACPVQAISVDEKTGAKIIDEKECIGCRVCEQECLFHMIGYIPEKNVCFKCDLCGGDPQCVSNCPFLAVKLAKT